MARRKQQDETAESPGSHSHGAGPESAQEPIPGWYTITNLDQLRSLSNDVRLKILHELALRPMTAKQVAGTLKQPPTRLYHHFDALAEVGLIRLVREVPKRGTTQRFYRAVAARFRVDESCLGSTADDERTQSLLSLLEAIRAEVVSAAASVGGNEPSPEQPIVGLSSIVTSSPQKMSELSRVLAETSADLSEEYSVGPDDEQPDLMTWRISVFIHPVVDRRGHSAF